MQTHYVVVSGSMSGLGKGTAIANIARIIKNSFNSVNNPDYAQNNQKLAFNIIKIDPYLNKDAGNMRPYEHGETYVLSDGSQVDLDFGTYERMLDQNLTSQNSITSGKVFWNVMVKEQNGDYNGATVQFVPHLTDEVQRLIFEVEKNTIFADSTDAENMDFRKIIFIELGGTIGDNESYIFSEALRQLRTKVGSRNFHLMHVTHLPELGELKTKPTQSSVRTLRELICEPEFLLCRCVKPISDEIRKKLSFTCGVNEKNIISMHDVDDIYKVSELFVAQNFPDCSLFNVNIPLINKINHNNSNVIKKIGIVGKYVKQKDSYLSLIHSINFAAWKLNINAQIYYFDSEMPWNELENNLTQMNCIIIPGGFGVRGVEGKIKTAEFARKNNVPFLGICLGMQIAIIEYFRNVKNINAHSIELDPDTKHPVFILNASEKLILGDKTIYIKSNSLTSTVYGTLNSIVERHRHRYVFNPLYEMQLDDLIISGKSDNLEIIELKNHKFYIGVQFHPEFNSKMDNPHPLFTSLLQADF